MHLVFPPIDQANAQIVEFLSRCEKQSIYARRFLRDDDLRQCLMLLYRPVDALITMVADTSTHIAELAAATPAAAATPLPAAALPAAEATPVESTPTPPSDATQTAVAPRDHHTGRPAARAAAANSTSTIDVVTEQLAIADQYYQYFTQRSVRIDYFRGIGIGTAVMIGLFALLFALRGALHAPIGLLWSILAGALGAVTSLVARATFGSIVLDRVQGGAWNTLLGAFRPLIGSLFGAAFYVFITAGFLPIQVPADGGRRIALYASIAFLAGFSHRWAQDTLKAAEAKLPGAPGPQEGASVQGGASRA